jgi:hypothetical protein
MRKLLLLPMLLLAACEGNGTTPCHGTIVTTFSGATWEDGDYVFTLGLNGTATCEFTLPGGECALPVEVDGDTLTIEHWSGTSQNPETVHVKLERDGTGLFEGDVTPTWVEEEQLSSSSGTCWSTDIDVDLGG